MNTELYYLFSLQLSIIMVANLGSFVPIHANQGPSTFIHSIIFTNNSYRSRSPPSGYLRYIETRVAKQTRIAKLLRAGAKPTSDVIQDTWDKYREYKPKP